ncbi:glycosyltransferase family 90 protein [Cucurbitaria berberidis CBS 394.84]|uniref:Glycosyltransferase family 90 protein n=1 Tax=Cucurbitaria berberidis CBS 394.84 TaxID=1168544 RepID=A0A9P4GC47_9PLEO|nr:glycosyltransferase family 90 protein [Cucurbitaria berberidis CBS 394.84]KAF1842912.1 glycosyltransferase family 90 protein [Cucurbitaria berberidis CBS 394.84]
MHPVVSLIAENVVKYHQLFAPLLFSIVAAVANVHSPVQHSLLVTAVSWLLIWMPIIFRVGIYSKSGSQKRKTSWLAGAFLGLSQICDRAACDKEGIWATKAFVPLFAVLISQNELLAKHIALPSHTLLDDPAAKTTTPPETHAYTGSYRILAALIVSASAVLATYVAPTTSALGFSSAMFAATGLVLFEAAMKSAEDDGENNTRGLVSANGSFSRRNSVGGAQREQQLAVLRDVAATITTACGIASYLIEPSMIANMISWEPVYRSYGRDWRTVHNYRVLQQVLWMIPINVTVNVLTFIMLFQQGAVHTSLLSLFSYTCAKLHFTPSFSGIWFTIIYGSSALLNSFGSSFSVSVSDIRTSIRIRRIVFGVTTLSIGVLLFRYAYGARYYRYSLDTSLAFPSVPPPSPFDPMQVDLSKGHPAAQLINAAETDFQNTLSRQSKSLADAVREYRRRHGIAPPPRFEKWYEFATRNSVVMIDEFDTINQMLLPFWALKPATIRSRITNALGHEDSALIAVAIRNGAVEHLENGDEWQQQATAGMMKDFVEYLPDMDLGFNIHDEPRVVVPTNLLASMISKARDEVLPRAAKIATPRNSFSARPTEMNDGKRFAETSTTKFNRFAHQQTWTHSRLSCPANTQSQTFEDYAADNLTAFSASPLGYLYNVTAFSDICNSPSLSSTFGFFERPNTFNIIHELTPVFSQSKISSFQDLLYPSPWYWIGKVGYNESHDTNWENKTNSLYWRGSTTGGFSRNGGWRRQHRQHIVRRLNAPDKAQIVVPALESADVHADQTAYSLVDIDRRSHKHLIDVKFSHVGQCDPGDCEAQKEFFQVTDRVDGQNAWYNKHLLDMDGNAFSGRFYSFLKSRSLTYKMAVFREWHSEWLRPWVHYIPLSLRGDEHLDLIKWFGGDHSTAEKSPPKTEKIPDKGGNGDSLGERKAREIAQRSTEWHDKVLRNVDFEVWLFRLLLEYGRVVDDNREEIGYPGP